jgi:glycosyltransferase involved in cell wall biosynthesis
VLWHTLWNEGYSNPRYAELLPRLEQVFFAPIRQRSGLLGRLDGAVSRRSTLIERRDLAWYRAAGLRLLLTPRLDQVPLFGGPAVVDLDDPLVAPDEQTALQAEALRHVIVTTDEVADYVRTANPIVDVTVIPQGVDLRRAGGARHEEVRREILGGIGLPLETPIVGYHAPFICLSGDREAQEEKLRTFHADVLVSAIRRLWSEDVSFVAVLAGKPSATVEELARKEKRLVIPGYINRNRLFDWVGAFDVGAYPRTLDFGGRQSVKLLEYMASSAAIIAMSTHETRLLDETRSGYTAGDAEQFCDLLRRLILRPDERLSLVQRGHDVVKDHDWRILAARYDEILAVAVGDR